MKKKLLISLICFALVFSACSCASGNSKTDDSGESKIIKDAKKSQNKDTQNDDKKQLTVPPTQTGKVSDQAAPDQRAKAPSHGDIDVDLTGVNKNVVYAQVMQMMMEPQNFVGKKIKMSGQFIVYDATPGNQSGATEYYAIIIADAMACCQQGIEFVWPGHTFPNDFPQVKSNTTVTGVFEVYEEDGNKYCRLIAENVESE